jgi:hypothetical protein
LKLGVSHGILHKGQTCICYGGHASARKLVVGDHDNDYDSKRWQLGANYEVKETGQYENSVLMFQCFKPST